MKTIRNYLISTIMLSLMIPFVLQLDAACIVGQTEHAITITGGSFPTEIGWSLINSTTGDTVASVSCGNGGSTSDTVCLNDAGDYCFEAYDDWGDGWNGGTYAIVDLSNGATVISGSPNNGITGDGTAVCDASQLEETSCLTVGVIAGCTDSTAVNHNPNANLDDGSCLFPPANDLCANAIGVNCGDTISGTTAGASADSSLATCGTDLTTAGGVWFVFAGDGSPVTASLCGSSYDTKIGVFSGACDTLTCIVGNDDDCGLQSQVTFSSVMGTDYYIYVTGFGANAGAFDLTITCDILGCTDPGAINYDPLATVDDGSCIFPPANDSCANAIAVACGDSVTGFTIGASPEFGLPFCGTAVNTAPGVWYSFAGNGDTVTVNLCGSSYDTKLGVFSNTCDSLTCVAGNDDDCGLQSEVTFVSTNGVNYYIYVSGFGAAAGDFSLAVSCSPDSAILGCTDPNAVNYNINATLDDGSCLYAVSFAVDMNCPDPDPGTIDTVFITGPFCSWCATGFPLTDADSNGVWEGTYNFPAGALEYKYMVNNFASQEDLIDDMAGGASCAPVTDFFSFANRLITVPATTSVNETYGMCSPCQTGPLGCTDPAAQNYDSTAVQNDGSCIYNITFSVDMNCSGETFSTVSITGPFCGWCGAGFELSDTNGDGIYEGAFPFASPLEYKYMVDGFASQENLVDDMVNGASCAPITDFFSFANRLVTFSSDTATNDNYGSCDDCFTCTEPIITAAQNISSSGALLEWSGDAPSYQVIGSKLGDPLVTFTTSNTELEVNNLLPNTGYYWTVVSICGDTTIASSIIDTFFTMPVCQGPTNLQTVDIGPDSAVFTWSASPNAPAYRIAVAEVPVDPNEIFITTVLAPNTSYVLKQLTPGTDYLWRIVGYCGYEGSPLSEIQSFSTTPITSSCATPENLFADSITDNCATLNWDPVPGAIGYNIKGNAVGGIPIDEFNINVTGTTFHLSGLNSGISYWWSVRAICDISGTDVSAFAANDSFTTNFSVSCVVPQNLFADSVTNNCAMLNWDPVSGALGYRVKGNEVGANPLNSFEVITTSTSFELTALSTGVSYWWSVQALCSITDTSLVSDYADPDTFTTTPAKWLQSATERDNLNVEVYPNPAKDYVSIYWNQSPKALRITDVNGKVIFSKRMNSGFEEYMKVDISEYVPGVYFMLLEFEDHRLIRKIVVTR